jgi:hypothetical protein
MSTSGTFRSDFSSKEFPVVDKVSGKIYFKLFIQLKKTAFEPSK